MNKSIKYVVLLVVLAGVTVGACNTFRGAGRDVEAAGRGIENAADEVQDELEDEN